MKMNMQGFILLTILCTVYLHFAWPLILAPNDPNPGWIADLIMGIIAAAGWKVCE